MTDTTLWYILHSSIRRQFITGTHYAKRTAAVDHAVELAIENAIMQDPEAGDLIQGTGGFRKLRMADPSRGKGKRGGFRVIYFDLPLKERTYLLMLYDKNEKDDLSAENKKALRSIAAQLRQEDFK